MGQFLVWVNWGEKTHYNYGYNHPRLDKSEKASWTPAAPSLCLLSWWQAQCHQMLLASHTMPSPPRTTVCPTTASQNESFLPCFMSSVFWRHKKRQGCVAYPRTIKKASILNITIFLWVSRLLPRHFEHINSLHYHTQCCFVKKGCCNLIFFSFG